MSTKVITGEVRFSYAYVFTPKTNDEGEPKYSSSILIPKKDRATVAKIEKAVEAAKAAGVQKFGAKFGKKPTFKLPLRDGDVERDDDEAYKGMWFLNASSRTKPGIVDADLEPIMSQDEFTSGYYGRASLNFYPFEVKGNSGIAVGLNNIQKLRGEDEDRLSGGSSAVEDFGGEAADELFG